MALDAYWVLAMLALSVLVAGGLAQLLALVFWSRSAQRIAAALLLPGAIVCAAAVTWGITLLLLAGPSTRLHIQEPQVGFLAAGGLVALVTLFVRAIERRNQPKLVPVRSFLYVLSGMLAVGAGLYLHAGASLHHHAGSSLSHPATCAGHQNVATAPTTAPTTAPAAISAEGAGESDSAVTCSVRDAKEDQLCDLPKESHHAPRDRFILTGGLDSSAQSRLGAR